MADPGRIVLDPVVLAGKPVVRGTRLSVEFIIGLMADGWSEADILCEYEGLTRDDLAACLAYARDVENDPRFLRRIEKARRGLKAGRGVPLEDV